jgi:hypothetical protein
MAARSRASSSAAVTGLCGTFGIAAERACDRFDLPVQFGCNSMPSADQGAGASADQSEAKAPGVLSFVTA